MAKRILFLMILTVFLVPLSSQAGLFDKLKERAKEAIQGSMNDVTDEVGQQVDNATGTASKKLDEVTGTVDQKANDVTNSVGNKMDEVTGTVDQKTNNMTSSVGNKMDNLTGTSSAAATGSQSQTQSQSQSQSNNISNVLSAAVAQGSGPYGPDVVGIRLGMSMGQAERIVRNHMQVGWVITTDSSVLTALGDAAQVRAIPKIFIDRNANEAIILDSNPSVGDQVLGVRRMLFFMNRKIDTTALKNKLIAKYGQPSAKGALVWGGNESCVSNWGPLFTKKYTFAEGDDPTKQNMGNDSKLQFITLFGGALNASVLMNMYSGAQLTTVAQETSGCGPVVKARLVGGGVDVYLADEGRLFSMFDKPKIKAAPPPITQVDF